MARIKYRDEPSLSIRRAAFFDDKLVYIARANRSIRYDFDSSDIVYIGTTKNGAWRIASSAATRGWMLFDRYGVKHLDFHIVTCTRIPGLKSWKKLERALLIRFRERFGEPPLANKQGARLRWKNERDYFSIDRLDRVIDGRA